MHARRHRAAAKGLALGLALMLPTAVLAAEAATGEAARVAQWVRDSKDNQHRPYIVVDKANARVFLFDASGTMKGEDAALLGMERGDKAVAGPGKGQLSPHHRITPAGRFLANLDRDAHGEQVLLIDYEHAIALHAVVKGTVAERRAERLASATPADNRISFGCINVPLAFFRDVVSPAFARTDGYVYILPESGKGQGQGPPWESRP